MLTGHGPALVVVDQPASIGALAIAVARSMGIEVGYLPGPAMRRIAELYPGEGKTDARDAFVIADAARTLPHTLRRVGPDEKAVAALGVLAGYDADLQTRRHGCPTGCTTRCCMSTRRWNGCWASTCAGAASWSCCRQPERCSSFVAWARTRCGGLAPRSRRLAAASPRRSRRAGHLP
ncbi:IS110 family transposase [Couchioplanes caeruleus]|uniref:IS110 family transposase n=1 Tax=Couchioplanes caeruleus TaxID=56438 RepID=UPI0008FF11F6